VAEKVTRGDAGALIDALTARVADGEAKIERLVARVELLERQAADWREAFSAGKLPPPRQYESQFSVWPGAGNAGVR
jgi:hypothetical protein